MENKVISIEDILILFKSFILTISLRTSSKMRSA